MSRCGNAPGMDGRLVIGGMLDVCNNSEVATSLVGSLGGVPIACACVMNTNLDVSLNLFGVS